MGGVYFAPVWLVENSSTVSPHTVGWVCLATAIDCMQEGLIGKREGRLIGQATSLDLLASGVDTG